MLTIEQIKEKLQDRKISVISEALNISRHTIANIKNGSEVVPSYQTVKALSDYLEGKESESK